MTQDRFEHASEDNELKLFSLSLQYLETCKCFKGIRGLIEKYGKIERNDKNTHYPKKDIFVKFKDFSKRLIVEIQYSNRYDFKKYGDIRLDYVSAYIPYIKIHGLKKFNEMIKNKTINVERWGKLKECDADVLIYVICEYDKITKTYKNIDEVLIFSIEKLQNNLNYWENEYGKRLKTNNKQNEEWGSAFIPVPADDNILQQCRITSLHELITFIS